MMGDHHVTVNFAMVSSGLALLGCGMASKWDGLRNYCIQSLDAIIPEEVCYTGRLFDYTVFFLFGALFFLWFGSLFPDVDNRKSTLGRWCPIPFRKHRRMTHTLWMLGLLSMLFAFSALFKWFWLGYFLHILVDSWSKAGVRWLYPITKYKEYASGAFIAEGHACQWYRAGTKSELRIVVLVVLFCVFCDLLFGFYYGGFRNVWNWMVF